MTVTGLPFHDVCSGHRLTQRPRRTRTRGSLPPARVRPDRRIGQLPGSGALVNRTLNRTVPSANRTGSWPPDRTRFGELKRTANRTAAGGPGAEHEPCVRPAEPVPVTHSAKSRSDCRLATLSRVRMRTPSKAQLSALRARVMTAVALALVVPPSSSSCANRWRAPTCDNEPHKAPLSLLKGRGLAYEPEMVS